jgi:hypothetical protein
MGTARGLMNVARFFRYRNRLPYRKAGDRECVLIGNGPSLMQTLATRSEWIRQRDSLCVNYFAESKEFSFLRPKYYVLLDPGFWKRDVAECHAVRRAQLLNIIARETDWPLHLFLPAVCEVKQDYDGASRRNPLVVVRYYNHYPVVSYWPIDWILYKYNIATPSAQNVLLAGCYIALNLGYKTLYLIGADHSWHEEVVVDDANRVCFRDKHFWDDSGEVKLLPVFKAGTTSETDTIHEFFFNLYSAFRGYHVTALYANRLGASIFNASHRSYIDAFPRYSFGQTSES